MADRSAHGWDTIAEYENDPMASDSDDWKKIRQAENRAVAKRKTKTFKRLTLRVLSQKPSGQQFRIDGDHNDFTPPNQRTSTSDFHRTILPRTATIDSRNGPVAQISDRGTRALVAVKEGTSANTAGTPDTETKVEGMEINNEFSNLSNDYTIQEFEFEKGNNYPSEKGRLKKNLIS